MSTPNSMPNMMMYFHTKFEQAIFMEDWKINSTAAVVIACVALGIMGLVYEAVVVLRKNINHKQKTGSKHKLILHLTQTFLHLIQLVLGYLLIIAVLTVNLWLCVSIVAGGVLGYFLFAWLQTSSKPDTLYVTNQ